jgi:hypothetical protein
MTSPAIRSETMAVPKHIGQTPGAVRDRIASFLQEHPGHRDEFLANPAAAIARHLGLHIPDVTVIAIPDTADTVHFVVPPDPDELGGATLERIAGGLRDAGSTQMAGKWLTVQGGGLRIDETP